MKRNFFAEMTSIESGTAIASQYEVPMSLTLPNFVIALNNVLDYYYKGNITAELNPEWIPSDKPTLVSISYTYIWDLVAKIYELYAVRWYLESVDGKCVIKIGFRNLRIYTSPNSVILHSVPTYRDGRRSITKELLQRNNRQSHGHGKKDIPMDRLIR